MVILKWIKEYLSESWTISKRRIKKMVLAAPFWVIVIALILIITGAVRAAVITSQRSERNIAEIWSQGGETGYRHVSVFARGARSEGETSPFRYIDADNSLKRSDIILIRTALQNTVDSGNLVKRKTKDPDGRPQGWEDCFSTVMTTDVVLPSENSSTPTTATSEIVAVEGNFKTLHPFEYLSGGFLPEVGVDGYQVVLNDILAWRFFSSYDVVGYKVNIFGTDFTVCGVVSEMNDSIAETCGAEKPRAYIYFSTLEKTFETPAESEEGSLEGYQPVAIQTYEALLPEAVTGVAKTDILTALPNYNASDPRFYIISNTGRYNVLNVWDFMMPFGEEKEKLAQYDLPYWERTAELAVEHLFVDGVLIVSGSVLLITGVFMAILKIKKPVIRKEDEKNG